jgi:hypothetical protein
MEGSLNATSQRRSHNTNICTSFFVVVILEKVMQPFPVDTVRKISVAIAAAALSAIQFDS